MSDRNHHLYGNLSVKPPRGNDFDIVNENHGKINLIGSEITLNGGKALVNLQEVTDAGKFTTNDMKTTDTTESTSPTTGSFIADGGVGIGKNLNLGGDVEIGVDASGTKSLKMYASTTGNYLHAKTDASNNMFWGSVGTGTLYLRGASNTIVQSDTGDVLLKVGVTSNNIRIGETMQAGSVKLGNSGQTGVVRVLNDINSTTRFTGGFQTDGGIGCALDLYANNIYANNLLGSVKGTVTQATSVTTGVTLNADFGFITCFGSSLTTQTDFNFTFTNDRISSTSTILVSASHQGTLALRMTATAYDYRSGSCEINVANVSNITHTSAVYVVHFRVLD